MSEHVPATSSSVPLINRYLCFTLCQVTLSIFLSILILNISYRSPTNSTAPGYLTGVLLRYLPKLLNIRRPDSVHLNNHHINSPYNNASTTNSTARSSISGFCYPASTCQSFVDKYQLESSQSEAELNSRLVWSRRSEDENAKLTALQSSASLASKSTSSSKRNSSDANYGQTSLKTHLHNHHLANNKSRPFEFEKAVYNVNFLAHTIQDTELYSKVCLFFCNIKQKIFKFKKIIFLFDKCYSLSLVNTMFIDTIRQFISINFKLTKKIFILLFFFNKIIFLFFPNR